MNKEQLEFFYNEIMGMFGWDDEDTASGVDPLLWAKKQIKDMQEKNEAFAKYFRTISGKR